MNKLESDLVNFGWQVSLIEASAYQPSFAYTAGLTKSYGHPEIIMFGLSLKTMHLIVNDIGEFIKSGNLIKIEVVYSEFTSSGKTKFIPVDTRNISDYFGQAINFYGDVNFDAIQLVWTEGNNLFPWDISFNEDFRKKQPLLDRNASFKFSENKDTAVFTTRQFIELQYPVLSVIHNHDGDWEFLTDCQFPEDIRVIALIEMINYDDTLNSVFNLDYGEMASREYIRNSWNVSQVDLERDN